MPTTTSSSSPKECLMWTTPPNTHIVGYRYDENGCQYPITECNEGFVKINGWCYRKYQNRINKINL